MFADAVAKITDSIFPIFYSYDCDGVPVMGVSGSGFFVDESGCFLTVDHIMSCAPPASTYYYYGQVPDSLSEPAQIECIARDPARDVFLGRGQGEDISPVALSTEAPRPGDAVCLSGYPMAVLSVNDRGGFVGNVRRYWQPASVIDATQAIIEGRTYDGYIVDHPCFSGMSGGPVFDVAGKVRGMAVATLTRTIPENDGEPYVVRNGIVVDGRQLRAFLDEHRASP
jgi:S1-C subfamily serine protease